MEPYRLAQKGQKVTLNQIEYRELTSADISAEMISDLNRLLPQLTSGAEPITEDWLDYLFGSGTRIFAAFDKGRVIGTVLLAPMVILVGQKDWIEDVVVDEAYRRLGISSRLMSMAETASRASDAKSVNLTSNPNRGGARKMYEDRGYVLRDTGVFRLTQGS